jgi:hypothetical protein
MSGTSTRSSSRTGTPGILLAPGTTWDKQLKPGQHDPDLQTIIEVASGHGNSEGTRLKEIRFDAGGRRVPRATAGLLPSCWRAGQLVEALPQGGRRCREVRGARGGRSTAARLHGDRWSPHVPDADVTDCSTPAVSRLLTPAFNSPGGSVQYALAISNLTIPSIRLAPLWLIASSDNHRARPGTGYKEFDRPAPAIGRAPRRGLAPAYQWTEGRLRPGHTTSTSSARAGGSSEFQHGLSRSKQNGRRRSS